jgi:hypothetical protein
MSHNREKETYPNKRRVVDQGRSMSNNISGRGPSSNSNNNPMQHGRGGYNRNQNQHQHQHHQQRNPNPHYNNRYDNNNNNFFSNRNNNSNNHGRNSNDRQSHPWETRNNRSNDPTPFTAQIEQQASLNDPIPRRSFNNNNINSSTTMTANNDGDNDTTMIQVDDDRHRATADPNRIPMELTQDWNLYSKEEQYRLLVRAERDLFFLVSLRFFHGVSVCVWLGVFVLLLLIGISFPISLNMINNNSFQVKNRFNSRFIMYLPTYQSGGKTR